MSLKRRFHEGLSRASADLVEYAIEMVSDQEIEAALEAMRQPPQLLVAVHRGDCVSVETIDLPGVEIEPAPAPSRRWVDGDGRVWLEEDADDTTVPFSTVRVIEWARERGSSVVDLVLGHTREDRLLLSLTSVGAGINAGLMTLNGDTRLATMYSLAYAAVIAMAAGIRLVKGV